MFVLKARGFSAILDPEISYNVRSTWSVSRFAVTYVRSSMLLVFALGWELINLGGRCLLYDEGRLGSKQEFLHFGLWG